MNLAQKRLLCALAPLVLAAAGCRSTWYPARFAPAPLEVQLAAEGEPQGLARALVSVRGIRRPDGEEPARAEMRMRIENLGGIPVRLLPESFELLTADLRPMGEPSVSPADVEPIPPEGSATYEVRFDLPRGADLDDYDLQGLNLRWTVAFGERRATTGVTFERVYHHYRDPYYPRSHFSFGVGVFHSD